MLIKEVGAKTEITKGEDNSLLLSIKSFFKKEKNVKLEIQESQGDVITLDVTLKFNPENKATDRIEARQASYDLKRKLEEFLFKEFSISTLSIQGMTIYEDNIVFEISFIWKNTDKKKATYNEAKRSSFINELGEIITLNSNVTIAGKKAKFLEFNKDFAVFEIEGEKSLCAYKFLENKVQLVSKKKVLKEGTWALRKESIKPFMEELQALQKKYWNLVGDEKLMNNIDKAIGRLHNMLISEKGK